MSNAPWYKNAVLYEVSVRSFKDSNGDGFGDLPGLIEKLDYLQLLGIDCVWLMPIYPSPLRDDGYDIADYCSIAPGYGNLGDFRALIESAHARGIRIIMDLVLNHTSDEHPWFKAACQDRTSPYRDYYVWSDTDQRFRDARVIFLDTEVSNWTLEPQSGQYYWHRFYSSQPDLNFENPRVVEEMHNVVRFWLRLGIDGFRVDAVPYLFEREGTSCENLPETHVFLKSLRALVEREFPGRIILCEANQWPEDVRAYLGEGDECHMGFHFPLMPRIFMALRKGRIDDVAEILARTPPIPENCQWCTFLRNHDELTLEMVSPQDRQWMWEQYAPEPGMRLNLGIRRRLAPLLDNDLRKVKLANSLLFTLPGTPIIYYGDELGMGDNLSLPDRNGLRTPMQWDDSQNGGFSSAPPWTGLVEGAFSPARVNASSQLERPGSLFRALQRMIQIRKGHSELGSGTLRWVEVGNRFIAAYTRELDGHRLLLLSNLTAERQSITMEPGHRGAYRDLVGGDAITVGDANSLSPYEFKWLQPLG